MKKNLKFQKAKKNLQNRITDYEEICARRLDNGRGFRRPGQLRVKK